MSGGFEAIDGARAESYPPNIQAILKRPAAAAAWAGQELIAIDAAAGAARIRYLLGEAHLNRFGAVHGGVTALLLDDVMSVAAGLAAGWGEITPTLSMTVSFLNPARPGAVTGTARILKRGRTVLFLEGRLEDGEGVLLATGSATVALAPMKR